MRGVKRRSWWVNAQTGQVARVVSPRFSSEGELLEVVISVRDATGVALVEWAVDGVEFDNTFRRLWWPGDVRSGRA